MAEKISEAEFAKIAKAFTEVAQALHHVLLQEVGVAVGFVLVIDCGEGKHPLSASNHSPEESERILENALSDLRAANATHRQRSTH